MLDFVPGPWQNECFFPATLGPFPSCRFWSSLAIVGMHCSVPFNPDIVVFDSLVATIKTLDPFLLWHFSAASFQTAISVLFLLSVIRVLMELHTFKGSVSLGVFGF